MKLVAYFYDDQGRLISDVDGKPYDGDYVRYNHEQAKAQTFAEAHVPLYHGQPIDQITKAELLAEYEWAVGTNSYAYAGQLQRGLEYKDQAEALEHKKRKEEERIKAVNKERVGDAERNRYSDHLAKLYGDGFVDQDEFERLNDLALSAKTRGDLAGLLTDLPPLPAVPPPFAPVVVVPQQSRLAQVASHITGRGLFIGVSVSAVLAVLALLFTLVVVVL